MCPMNASVRLTPVSSKVMPTVPPATFTSRTADPNPPVATAGTSFVPDRFARNSDCACADPTVPNSTTAKRDSTRTSPIGLLLIEEPFTTEDAETFRLRSLRGPTRVKETRTRRLQIFDEVRATQKIWIDDPEQLLHIGARLTCDSTNAELVIIHT